MIEPLDIEQPGALDAYLRARAAWARTKSFPSDRWPEGYPTAPCW